MCLGIELGQQCKRVRVCHLLVESFCADAMLCMRMPGFDCELYSTVDKPAKYVLCKVLNHLLSCRAQVLSGQQELVWFRVDQPRLRGAESDTRHSTGTHIYLQFDAHVIIYSMLRIHRIQPGCNIPSNSSHTTSPVLGDIAIMATFTRSSVPIPPRGCSNMHIRGGAALGSNSSTVLRSSTYLRSRKC